MAPLHSVGGQGVALSGLVFVLLAPVVIPRAMESRRMRWWGSLTLLCLVTAPLATLVSITEYGREFSTDDAAVIVSFVVAMFVLGTVIVATIKTTGRPRIALVCVALGALVQAVGSGALSAENPWKFGLAFPVALALLCIPGWGALALLLVAAMCAVLDFRSLAGIALLSLLVVLWRSRSDGSVTLRQIAGFAVLGYGAVQLMTWALVEGWLGATARERTVEQLGSRNSLLLAARPESAAAWGVAQVSPQGLGPGVLPSTRDVSAAKNGLHQVGAGTSGDYVESYMLGGVVRVHSGIGDLWVSFGIAGLILGVFLLLVALRELARLTGDDPLRHLKVFLALLVVWSSLFSPLRPDLVMTSTAVALLVATSGWSREDARARATAWQSDRDPRRAGEQPTRSRHE